MAQRDDMDFIVVRTAEAERPEISTSMLSRIVQQSKPAAKKPLIRWKEQSGITNSIFNFQYSVFFGHLPLLEQMRKEIPGIRPAMMSTEPWTRMDEDYNAETTPVNNLECKAEEKTSHIVLVNATCFSTFS